MKERKFEDFLQDMCFSINPTVLDDDMPDFFDNFMSNLEIEDLLRWADMFAQERFLAGMDRVIKQVI